MKSIQIAYDSNFQKKCKIASEVGFKYVAVNFHNMEDISNSAYDSAPEQIKGILDKYGLTAVQSHLYYYHLLTSAEIIDEDLERRIMREIEVSGKLGIPWCVWHPRAYQTNGYSKELSFEWSKKTVSKYLEQAGRYGTGVALENLFNWYKVTMYCPEYEDLAELTDCFGTENVGVCWDFGHANLMKRLSGLDQAEAIRYLGNRIKCTHIHNNFGDGYDLHLPPDAGNIEWDKVMAALKEIGYSGPLTLETHCRYQDDEILLKDFAAYNFKCLEFLQRL